MTHLEKDLELNILKAPDELQMNTMTQKQKTASNEANAGNINSDTNNSNLNKNKIDRQFEIVCLQCGLCGNINYPAEECYYGAKAANRALPWKSKPARPNGPQVQDQQNNITDNLQASAQLLN